MQPLNTFGMMKNIAAKGLAAQIIKDGDHTDENGLLICGVCGEYRQKIMEFADPCEGDPEKKSPLKVCCKCRCERELEAEKERKEQERRNLDKIESLRRASLLDDRFRDATFENFSANQYNERNLALCKRYISKFDLMVEKNQGLLFWGGVGTGKTYAAACIANALLSKAVPVIMTSFVRLLALIQSGEDSSSSIINRLNSAKLVIFDDLGAERNTGYALEKVYQIVDERYRRKLPSIFTTNLTVSEMQNEADPRFSRIYDRIFEICYPMQFVGPSWRRREAGRRFVEMEKLLEED